MKKLLQNKKIVLCFAWIIWTVFFMYYFKTAFDISVEGKYLTIPFFITLFVVAFGGVINIFERLKQIKIETLFVIVALSSGILFATIMPFGQEPDGFVHFERSMDVSYGNLLLPFIDNDGNGGTFYLPENIKDVEPSIIESGMGQGRTFTEQYKNLYYSDEVVQANGMGGFASFFYLPQALGIVIARMFGFSAYGYMICGRLVNLLSYVGLVYCGLKKMPVFRNIYLVIALLPVTIAQATSFSYDALLNGLSLLFIGWTFSLAYQKEQLTWRDVLPLGIILALMFMCKYVYVAIGLLVFIIPMKKFGVQKNYWYSFVIALVPLALLVLAMFAKSAVPTVSTQVATPVGSDVVENVTQLGYILQHPLHLVKVILNTFMAHASTYIAHLGTLGWLNLDLGICRYIIPIVMVSVTLLDSKHNKISCKDRFIYIVAFFAVTILGMLGLYLFDTYFNPVGALIVNGYQGRYMIPVFVLLLASFSTTKIECKIEHFSNVVLGVMCMLLAYSASFVALQCY